MLEFHGPVGAGNVLGDHQIPEDREPKEIAEFPEQHVTARSCARDLFVYSAALAYSWLFALFPFMIFLLSGGAMMIQRGERGLAAVVIASAVFCAFWLKRDAGKAIKMIVK